MDIQITQIDRGEVKAWWLRHRAEEDIIVPPEGRVIVPVTIIHLEGALDGSSYEELVATARAQVENGACRMVIDLERVPMLSKAGLTGLYMVGRMLEGAPVENLEGWAIMQQMQKDFEHGRSFSSLHLAAPGEKIAQTLSASNFNRLVRILEAVDEAIAFFPDDSPEP